jgi:ADP-ribosylglycohydrolase
LASSSVELKDRFLGCLLGCAVGDALGAPFEGLWPHSIPDAGTLLSGFAEFEGYPRGQYTDDTQLSVATVRAILKAGQVDATEVARSIARLWKTSSVIGPGGACTRAAHQFLKRHDWTTCGAPVGQAGNGTAMRAAVVGLFFTRQADRLAEATAAVSRITHQDPRSVAGGVAVAKAAQLLAAGHAATPDSFCDEVAIAMRPFEPDFAALVRELPRLLAADSEKVVSEIAWSGMLKPEFDEPIITPFVIPTVLAVFWCVLRYPDSWEGAVVRAIRLGGDVDTLGAIVGALLGAKLGLSAIPRHLVEGVQDSESLRGLALRYHGLVAGTER